MASLAEYFTKHRYKPKYFLGDRVRGFWNNIPFSGSVANDSQVDDSQEPKVSVFLDLPIKHGTGYHTIITVTHNMILDEPLIAKSTKNKATKQKVGKRKS